MFDTLLEGCQVLGFDWRYLYLNAAAEGHNRRPNASLIGRVYQEAWPGIEQTEVCRLIRDGLESRHSHRLENDFVFPDGTSGSFELLIQPVPEGVLIQSFDIGPRRSAEARVRRLARLYSTLSQINQTIVRARDRDELFRTTVSAVCGVDGVLAAWVGRSDGGLAVPLAMAGPGTLPATLGAHPVVEAAGRSGEVQVGEPGQGVAAVPFVLHQGQRGVFVLAFDPSEWAGTDAERRLLQEIGDDLSFALEAIERNYLRQKWADAFEYCGHSLVIGDPATNRILSCNRAFARLHASTVEAMSGTSFIDQYLPEERAKVRDWMAECDRVGTVQFQTKKVREDGSVYEAEMEVVSVRNDRGDLVYRIATEQDVTARNTSQRELEASRRRLDLIFRSNPVGLALTRQPDGIVFEANEAFGNILGYTTSELLGHSALELGLYFSPSARASLFESLSREGRLRGFETQMRHKDGTARHVRLNIDFVDIGGEPFTLAAIEDISKLKAAQEGLALAGERLRQVEKMDALGQLAGGIAHDFNNVLAGIVGFTALALKEAVPGSPLARHLGRIDQAVGRAKGLTRQILTFTRSGPPVRDTIDPGPLVYEVVELLRATLPSSVTLSVEVAPRLGALVGDPTALHELVINLATNAVHAMEGRGELRLRLTEVRLDQGRNGRVSVLAPGDYLLLEVSDTGSGMSPEVLARAFDPFYTTKPVGQGTGMGLAVVLAVVQAHGGDLIVETQEGHGTRFELYFPRSPKGLPGTSDIEVGPVPRGNGERILFVDDEPMIVEAYQQYLEGLGYSVTGFDDPRLALAALGDGRFDLLVTDQTMPAMTGLRLVNEAKQMETSLKTILCTGNETELPGEPGTQVPGVDRVAPKPVLPSHLARLIRLLLGPVPPLD